MTINEKIVELRDKGYSFPEIQVVIMKLYETDLSEIAVKSRYQRQNNKRKDEVTKEAVDVTQSTDVTIEEDGTQVHKKVIEIACEADKSPDRIMELHGYDPTQWILTKSQQKSWNAYSKQDGIKDLYSSTITVKPIQKHLTKEFLEEIFNKFNNPPVLEEINYQKSTTGKLLLELPIMDFHLGKLAWSQEVGEDYDLKIAERLYKETVLDILSRIKTYGLKIEKIIFPIGQDFFNIDDENNQTTKGTPQDTDSRWQKMFEKGVELLIWTFEHLRRIAPVESMYVVSNHDYKMSYFAAQLIKAYYRNLKSITVDTSPRKRKYLQYGVNLIGYTHGDTEKGRLETVMQAEVPEMWGSTIFREFHLGHLHSEHVKEIPGVILRRISSITSVDKWHSDSAYVAVVRKAQAFIWDKKKGKQLVIESNIGFNEEEIV